MHIFSKFEGQKGVKRHLEDFMWTLKTFDFENTFISTIGYKYLSSFKKNNQIDFFKEVKDLKLMLRLIKEGKSSDDNKPTKNNLNISLTSQTQIEQELNKQYQNKIKLNESIGKFDMSIVGNIKSLLDNTVYSPLDETK